MVKVCILPNGRVVAVRTGLRELRRFVIRIHGRRVMTQVTGDTFLSSSLVNAIFMAIYTSQRCVTPRQRELRVCRMVETRTLPRCHGMTHRAILRKSGGTMVRILRPVVVTEMTGYTFLRFSLIDPVLVAVRAGKRFMTAS